MFSGKQALPFPSFSPTCVENFPALTRIGTGVLISILTAAFAWSNMRARADRTKQNCLLSKRFSCPIVGTPHAGCFGWTEALRAVRATLLD